MSDESERDRAEPPSTSPSSPPDAASSEEEWCEVLERFGLDHEQAEALTRITAERALSWFERWASATRGGDLPDSLVDRPTHPDVLRRGLELYRKRKGFDES